MKREKLESQVQLVSLNVKEDNIGHDKFLSILYIILSMFFGLIFMLLALPFVIIRKILTLLLGTKLGSFVEFALRMVVHLVGVIICPYGVTKFLDYVSVNYGISIPWPLDMVIVPFLTVIFIYFLQMLTNIWWYSSKCGVKGSKAGRIIGFSFAAPILATIGSYAIEFVPFLKIPLIFIDKALIIVSGFLGDWVADLVDGVKYVPGYFIALILLALPMTLAMKC